MSRPTMTPCAQKAANSRNYRRIRFNADASDLMLNTNLSLIIITASAKVDLAALYIWSHWLLFLSQTDLYFRHHVAF